MNFELGVAIANVFFCLWRLVIAARQGRLSAIVWALAMYFSILFVPVVTGGSFKNYRGFSGVGFTINQNTIALTSYYIAAFHVLFALTEKVVWRLVGIPPSQIAWHLPVGHRRLLHVRWVFLAFLCVGGFLYWYKMRDLGYRDYVEYAGSNWPAVFLWASSPFITISMMQRRYWSAALAVMPFLYYGVMLHIRSFALLSLIPAVVIAYFHLLQGQKIQRSLLTHGLKAGMLVGVLLLFSVIVIQQKGGTVSLPDSGMPYGTAIVIEAMQRDGLHTEFNSLIIYGRNLVNPFIRLFGIELPHLVDTPVYMALLIDGVPATSSVYFHYPTLWYGDAYVSFGIAGLMLATLWAIILTGWEAIMLRYPTMIALMLPFYVWHTYMLVRGTPGGATVPFSYAWYISALVFILFCGGGVFRRQSPPAAEQPGQTLERPGEHQRFPIINIHN